MTERDRIVYAVLVGSVLGFFTGLVSLTGGATLGAGSGAGGPFISSFAFRPLEPGSAGEQQVIETISGEQAARNRPCPALMPDTNRWEVSNLTPLESSHPDQFHYAVDLDGWRLTVRPEPALVFSTDDPPPIRRAGLPGWNEDVTADGLRFSGRLENGDFPECRWPIEASPTLVEDPPTPEDRAAARDDFVSLVQGLWLLADPDDPRA